MLKFLGTLLEVIAGFLLFVISLAAFMSKIPAGLKIIAMLIFLAPAALSMVLGLSLMGFRQWQRDIGIVLLSATGLTLFSVLSFGCIMMNDELRNLLGQSNLQPLDGYITGIAFNAALAALGWTQVKKCREVG